MKRKKGFQHQKTWDFTKMCVKLLIHLLSTSDGWIFIMIYRYLSVILDITWDFTWDRYLLLSIVMDIVMDEGSIVIYLNIRSDSNI